MDNFAILLSYDGSSYFGFQKTLEGPSIQSLLEEALSCILNEKISIQAASRTDRGVHATNAVINFLSSKNFSLEDLLYHLNGYLPKKIRIKKIRKMNFSFHPTLDAIAKEYHYFVYLTPTLSPFYKNFFHYPYPVHLELIQKAIIDLVGENDFSSFTQRKEINNICKIETIDLFTFSHGIRISIKANRFLYKMCRILVGTLLEIGSLKIKKNIKDLLISKNRALAGITAPAHALILNKVFYPLEIERVLL